MSAITKPLLPPKAGYVEVIDENGNHVYKPTKQTETQKEAQAALDQLLVAVLED